MKKVLTIIILLVQLTILIALAVYFNFKGVTWNNIAQSSRIQAVSTSAGEEVTKAINTALHDFFSSKSSEFENVQFVTKEIVNNSEICILEINVIVVNSSKPQKSVYELWVVLNTPTPKVFIKNNSITQDYDFLHNT